MNNLFRLIPSVDKLIHAPQGQNLIRRFGRQAFVNSARRLLDELRQHLQTHHDLPDYFDSHNSIFEVIEQHLQQTQRSGIRRVFNLTGTILHTNLGRSIWSENAANAAMTAMRNNVALEYDLASGARGHRDQQIAALLQRLTGAESACIVNNNAAAVLLMLATFAQGKEVIISRGELVEIGGAFRIPDIMAQAGCKLVEVGTTNRTHLNDYRRAITENTAFLMKVHTSNYQIQGFTASVSEEELVALGRECNLPVISDLGSGALCDLTQFGLANEPLVQQKVAAGVELVSFSGDKLLGGPQAGIIVGKKALIEQLQSHPLKRVLRCDKVILAGLEATLRHYLFPDRLPHELPTLQLLTQSLDTLQQKALRLQSALRKRLDDAYILQIEASLAQIGSGALPTETCPSLAVTVSAPDNATLLALEAHWKQLPNPIIGRIARQKIWLDLRSVSEFDALITMLENDA